MVMLISLKSICATVRAREPVSAANENVCETTRSIPCVIAVGSHFEYISNFMELGKKRREYFFSCLPQLYACVMVSLPNL